MLHYLETHLICLILSMTTPAQGDVAPSHFNAPSCAALQSARMLLSSVEVLTCNTAAIRHMVAATLKKKMCGWGLQEDSGLHMEAFVTYCHLQRAGHVVRRFPCLLKHNEGRLVDVHKVWQHSWRDSARVCKAQNVALDQNPDAGSSAAPTSTVGRKSTSGVCFMPSYGHMAGFGPMTALLGSPRGGSACCDKGCV